MWPNLVTKLGPWEFFEANPADILEITVHTDEISCSSKSTEWELPSALTFNHKRNTITSIQKQNTKPFEEE